jgi:hypothetical protein
MKTMKKIITLIGATLLLTALSTSSSFAGKPAGGGGGKVAVESANPGSAIQGEEKDIYISGSGFGPGANVRYLVTGTDDDTQIEVLSTEYIDATGELKTRVKVKDSATVIDYDIEVQATSGRKGKGTTLFKVEGNGNGGGGGKPGGEDPPPEVTSCADKTSFFPAFAYTAQKLNSKGIYGYDFYLSNADGDCAIKIHTSDYQGNDLEFSYSQNGNDGVLIWRQDNNEYAGRKDVDAQYDRIKMIRFQTSAIEVTASLPLASTTVAVTTANHNSFRYIDLSADGNKIAVSVGNNDAGGETVNSISEIDVSSCFSNCSLSAPLLTSTESLTNGLGYSPFMDRIYYTGKYRDNSPDPLVGQYYIAFIENQGGSWSPPRFVTLSGNGFHGDPSYFRQPDVAIADLGYGPTEVLAFHYLQSSDTSAFDVQIIDVGTCSAAGAGDCLSSGESSIFSDIFDGKNASFNDKSNATSILFTTSTGIIIEHDLISGYEVNLADGFQADSGY